MRAVEHYLESERLLQMAGETADPKVALSWQRDAQVHATLALAGATALQAYSKGGEPELDDWEFHVGGEETP